MFSFGHQAPRDVLDNSEDCIFGQRFPRGFCVKWKSLPVEMSIRPSVGRFALLSQ